MNQKLEGMDEKRIPTHGATPAEIALTAARAARTEIPEAWVLEVIDTSAQEFENGSHIAGIAGVSANNVGSEIAEIIHHDIHGSRFAWIAGVTIDQIAARAKHSPKLRAAHVAAEFGRQLARHVSEKTFAIEANGCVAPSTDESDKIDVRANGDLIQVSTCFPNSDATTGKTVSDKGITADDAERLDAYVVLHYKPDSGEFGVGINDLNDGGRDTDYGESAPAKANRA